MDVNVTLANSSISRFKLKCNNWHDADVAELSGVWEWWKREQPFLPHFIFDLQLSSRTHIRDSNTRNTNVDLSNVEFFYSIVQLLEKTGHSRIQCSSEQT